MSRAIIVSPLANAPVTAGNVFRVNAMVELFKAADFEVIFCLIPMRIFSQKVDVDLLREDWRDDFFLFEENGKYRGDWRVHLYKLRRSLAKKISRRLKLKVVNNNVLDGHIAQKTKNLFSDLLAEKQPDVVIFEYAVFSPLAKLVPENVATICDTHDSFSNRNIKLFSQGVKRYWLSTSVGRQAEMLRSFDRVLAMQNEERDIFIEEVGDAVRVDVLDIISPPLGHDLLVNLGQSIGCIGGDNSHNVQGLKWFVDNCWPEIKRAAPNVRLIVAGKLSRVLADYIQDSDIDCLGYIDDVKQFYASCRFCINPSQGGSGLKIKNIEAFSYGKAIVSNHSSAIGCEQFTGNGLLLAEEKNFSSVCISLLSSDEQLIGHAQRVKEKYCDIYNKNLDYVKGILKLKPLA